MAIRRERFIQYGNTAIVISDYNWWIANQLELQLWLENNTKKGCQSQTGMIVDFANEAELLVFFLKWQ